MRTDMVVAYVRDLLETMTGSRPQPDADGDLPVSFRGALFYVRVVGSDPVVQVFSVAVADLEATPELHEALNDINCRLRFARAFHVEGQVLVEHEIWGTDVNPTNFSHACGNVAQATDYFGPQLVERFGGVARFEDSKTEEYEPSTAADAVGPYL